MIYLNIRNETDQPQTVEGILLEVQDDGGGWQPVTVLHPGIGIYADFGGTTQLKKAKLLDFQDTNLQINLGSGTLAPHHVASGWLLLEFPEQFRERNMLFAPLRITVCSGFGERETHKISNVDLG